MAVNSTLVREEDRVQLPVYYINRALQRAKGRYTLMEKVVFALITIAQKLRLYFQTHTIMVQTNKPLRRTMNNPEAARLLVLWAIELGEFDVQYRP